MNWMDNLPFHTDPGHHWYFGVWRLFWFIQESLSLCTLRRQHDNDIRNDLPTMPSLTLADWFLSSQKQELQSTILRPRLVLAKQPVKTELRQNFWSDLSGQRASPGRKYFRYLALSRPELKLYDGSTMNFPPAGKLREILSCVKVWTTLLYWSVCLSLSTIY